MTATPEPQFPDSFGSNFNTFIAAAERELAEHLANVKDAEARLRRLRRHQRQARRQELLRTTPHAALATAKYGLVITGLTAFLIAAYLLITGQEGGIEFFIAGATAWGTAAVIPS